MQERQYRQEKRRPRNGLRARPRRKRQLSQSRRISHVIKLKDDVHKPIFEHLLIRHPCTVLFQRLQNRVIRRTDKHIVVCPQGKRMKPGLHPRQRRNNEIEHPGPQLIEALPLQRIKGIGNVRRLRHRFRHEMPTKSNHRVVRAADLHPPFDRPQIKRPAFSESFIVRQYGRHLRHQLARLMSRHQPIARTRKKLIVKKRAQFRQMAARGGCRDRKPHGGTAEVLFFHQEAEEFQERMAGNGFHFLKVKKPKMVTEMDDSRNFRNRS